MINDYILNLDLYILKNLKMKSSTFFWFLKMNSNDKLLLIKNYSIRIKGSLFVKNEIMLKYLMLIRNVQNVSLNIVNNVLIVIVIVIT